MDKALCDGETLVDMRKIYEAPPWWVCLTWALSLALMVCTVFLSMRTIWCHVCATRRSGFTRGFHVSLGVRADLTVAILALPLSHGVTAAIQTVFPGTSEVMAFIRTLHFSVSIMKCIFLFHILAGGDDCIGAMLPKSPVKAFNAPPLCCIFCWPCCKRPLRKPRDIQIFLLAIKQFTICAPVITLVDILVKERASGGKTDNIMDRVVFLLVASSSMTAMWAFNALSGLIAPIVQQLRREYPAPSMRKFVTIHMLAGKIIDLLVVLAMQRLHGTLCVKDWRPFASMMSGFLVVIVSFVLAAVGPQMFPWCEAMYRPRDEQGLPQDLIPLLQLNGVNTHEWPALSSLVLKVPPVTEECEQHGPSFQSTTTGEALRDGSCCGAAGGQSQNRLSDHSLIV